MILNWLLAVLWCVDRGCQWCAGPSQATLQPLKCGPVWSARQVVWACCSIYLTYLIRMRSIAFLHAKDDRPIAKKCRGTDKLGFILSAQSAVLFVCITCALVRFIWDPMNKTVGTAAQAFLSVILFLTAAALGISINDFKGPLRTAERVARQATGRRQQDAYATARAVRHQLAVNIFGLLMSVVSMACDFASHMVWAYLAGSADYTYELLKTGTYGLDMVANALVVLFLSGIVQVSSPRRVDRCAPVPSARSLGADPGWEGKVSELAGRGLSLRALLKFYAGLGQDCMTHFDPEVHTTGDVVRQAIIPLTADDPRFGPCALATQLMDGAPTPAQRMVTHAWSNRFAHLVAAMVADALGYSTYESFLPRLQAGSIPELMRELEQRNKLHITYWVCAFSVNQHAGICGANPMREIDPSRVTNTRLAAAITLNGSTLPRR